MFADDRFFGFPGFTRFAFLTRFVLAFVFLAGFPFALALFPFAFPFVFGLGSGALGAGRGIPLRASPAFAAVAFVTGGFAFGPPLGVAFGRRLPGPGPGFMVAFVARFRAPRDRSGPRPWSLSGRRRGS
jgi:hypothetical protein